jgi:hypothetical protein
MDNLPRQKLREILIQYGRSVCEDPAQCEALLQDSCGEYKREIFVLIGALKEGTVADLLTFQEYVPSEILLTRLTKRLQDNLALSRDAAYWAVESWALALGMNPQPAQPPLPPLAGEFPPSTGGRGGVARSSEVINQVLNTVMTLGITGKAIFLGAFRLAIFGAIIGVIGGTITGAIDGAMTGARYGITWTLPFAIFLSILSAIIGAIQGAMGGAFQLSVVGAIGGALIEAIRGTRGGSMSKQD